MASFKFYDITGDGQFDIRDVNSLIGQHPNLPSESQSEIMNIAMGLVSNNAQVGSDGQIEGSTPVTYDDPTGDTSDTEIEAGDLGDAADPSMEGVGGTSGFGFDDTTGGFNPQDRTEVTDYLSTLGFDDDLIAKIQGNINLYDPGKEQELQTQYGFDVGTLGQTQRGSILEGMAGAGQKAFAGKGLVGGKRRSQYRQGISESQKQFETGLAQKQFGFASDVLEAQKDYDFVGELHKLKELGQISDGEFQSATDTIRVSEEAGLQGDVPMGYATQQEYQDSQNLRSEVPSQHNFSAAKSSGDKYIELSTPPGLNSTYYGPDSSYTPKWKGFGGEIRTYTVNPMKRQSVSTSVGNQIIESTHNMPAGKQTITATWQGPAGQGEWDIRKSNV